MTASPNTPAPRVGTPMHAPLYRCPACAYDVSRTLSDGIETCPECGGTITYALCRVPRSAGEQWRGLLWLTAPGLAWAGALAAVFALRLPYPGLIFGAVWVASAIALLARVRAGAEARGEGPIERMMWALAVIVINMVVFGAAAAAMLIALA